MFGDQVGVVKENPDRKKKGELSMCQSNAYLQKSGDKKLFMEDVSEVIPTQEGLTLKGMLGEEKFIKANIKKLALTDHEIILEEK